MYYSDPMPGENFENSAEREKALAEQAAIKNGENFNPNISNEDAEKFNNLESEVPFAGDNLYSENTVEDTTAKVSEGSPAAQMIASEYNAGQVADLDGVEHSTKANYIEGAAEAALTDADAVAAQTEAVKETGGDDNEADPYAPKKEDQPEAVVVAGAASAIAVHAEAERAAQAPSTFDDAKFEQDLQKTQEVLEKAASSTELNANNQEAQIANNLIEQSREKLEEAKAEVDEAKANEEQIKEEFGEIDDETQAKIEKQAEQNGTTAFEEAQKLAEEEKQRQAEAEAKIQEDVNNYMAGAIFG